LDLPDEV